MSSSYDALAHVASLMPLCSSSEHRVLTAVALQLDSLDLRVKLSLTDLEQLTGLSRSGVRNGLREARANGRLNQTQNGNTFTYLLCHEVTQNMSRGDTFTMSRGDTCVTKRHKTMHDVTQQNESSLYTKKKERTLERVEDSKDEKPQDERAYSELAYAVGHHNAEWLRDKREFDYVRAYALWGDQLENLWKAAVHCEARKPKDKAIFRFQDACEGNLDLAVKPESKVIEEDSAAPKIRFGDVVSHPVEGEFIADFQALYHDEWRCPEGHFIPAEELRVVRSTDA